MDRRVWRSRGFIFQEKERQCVAICIEDTKGGTSSPSEWLLFKDRQEFTASQTSHWDWVKDSRSPGPVGTGKGGAGGEGRPSWKPAEANGREAGGDAGETPVRTTSAQTWVGSHFLPAQPSCIVTLSLKDPSSEHSSQGQRRSFSPSWA
jgi:hypothetical protein